MLLLLTGGAASNRYEFGTSRFVPRRMEDVECDEGRVALTSLENLSLSSEYSEKDQYSV
jgi:hypothetical protein